MRRLLVLVIAIVLGAMLLPVHDTAAAVNDFRINTYDIQYELSQDSEGRSVLKTVETITAIFPQTDQNHGIERAIPKTYDGHPTSLKIESVTDADGKSLEYTTDTQNDNKVLRIGNADVYVHGITSYVITYTQRDVTKFYEDTNKDEWYWDTNGTEWEVPIDLMTITVKFDDSLITKTDGDAVCYQGYENSTTKCEITQNDSTTYKVTALDLAARQNVSLAFGFTQGTFQPYKMSTWDIIFAIWVTLQFLVVPLGFAIVIASSIIYSRVKNRTTQMHTLVAEYVPPKDASVLVSSQVIGTTKGSVFSAQLIDLAVRRFISIIETKPKAFWTAAEYDIVITKDPKGLLDEEREIIQDMFGFVPKVGDTLALKTLKNNTTYGSRTLDNDTKLKKLIEGVYGVREKSPIVSKSFYRWAIIIGVAAVLLLSIPLGLVALIVWIQGVVIRPLTEKGVTLRRYVLGLDRYIKASETERLAFLQGPDTAEKVGHKVDAKDPGQLVKLYERVLPYAILFGREKEWAKRLGDFYGQTNTSPDWYSGSTTFNAALFASTVGSISQASAYSAGSSASSGGSSGGGSSGGGGGGGGGGGW